MLTQLMAMTQAQIKSRIESLDVSSVQGRGLRRKFEKIRARQGGFTLLELLVVVAILAAIAGTATIMLQDTDRKGAAAAHVAMMDELSKGIQTYRVLNNAYPDVWDSLFASATGVLTGASPLAIISEDLYDSATPANIDEDVFIDDDITALRTVGITRVRVVDESATPEGFLTAVRTCANSKDDDGIGGLIRSKLSNVTAQNIFRTAEANGCGAADNVQFEVGDPVMVWVGDPQRVGVPIGATSSHTATDNRNKLIAFGIGPDSTLFSPSQLGAMSTTPVYRHVASDEYNRFIVLFNVNPTKIVHSIDDTGTGSDDEQAAGGQAIFQAIIDGAGDTKDEELGEFDSVRPT